jgi:hypothetical protein
MDLPKISTLTDPTSDEVIELLARAYYTNPIHIAAFGGSGEKELQLNRGLFHMLWESYTWRGFRAVACQMTNVLPLVLGLRTCLERRLLVLRNGWETGRNEILTLTTGTSDPSLSVQSSKNGV